MLGSLSSRMSERGLKLAALLGAIAETGGASGCCSILGCVSMGCGREMVKGRLRCSMSLSRWPLRGLWSTPSCSSVWNSPSHERVKLLLRATAQELQDQLAQEEGSARLGFAGEVRRPGAVQHHEEGAVGSASDKCIVPAVVMKECEIDSVRLIGSPCNATPTIHVTCSVDCSRTPHLPCRLPAMGKILGVGCLLSCNVCSLGHSAGPPIRPPAASSHHRRIPHDEIRERKHIPRQWNHCFDSTEASSRSMSDAKRKSIEKSEVDAFWPLVASIGCFALTCNRRSSRVSV